MNHQISLVIPVYNEEGNLRTIHQELSLVMPSISLDFEIIFIDDGSTDHSYEILQLLNDADLHVKVIQFRRNFGQTAAFAAGFDFASGDVIVTLDADGQNNPADIPLLIHKMDEGDYDFVTGWRTNRKEPFARRLLSHFANLIISKSSKVIVHDRGCSLKCFKSDLAKSIRLYGQLHRFLPELASTIGVRVAEVPIIDRPRLTGKSKYGVITRTPRVILDLVTVIFLLTFFTSPMRLFGSIAIISGIAGILVGGSMALAKIWAGISGGWAAFHAYTIGDRPLLLLAVLLVVVAVQFLMMGLLGEMLIRIYYEARDKPAYYIRKILQ